jgi:hypothetical protein
MGVTVRLPPLVPIGLYGWRWGEGKNGEQEFVVSVDWAPTGGVLGDWDDGHGADGPGRGGGARGGRGGEAGCVLSEHQVSWSLVVSYGSRLVILVPDESPILL